MIKKLQLFENNDSIMLLEGVPSVVKEIEVDENNTLRKSANIRLTVKSNNTIKGYQYKKFFLFSKNYWASVNISFISKVKVIKNHPTYEIEFKLVPETNINVSHTQNLNTLYV